MLIRELVMENNEKDRDKRNLALNERLLFELIKAPVDLVEIESSLKELKGASSCLAATSKALLEKLFPSNMFANQGEVADQEQRLSIIKTWVTKKGDYDYEGTLDNIVNSVINCNPDEEVISCEIFKTLVNEGGMNIKLKANSDDSIIYIPILHKALNGIGYCLHTGFQFKFNIKLLDFLLESGASVGLVPAINMVETTVAAYNAERRSRIPELFTIWDIVKEAKPALGNNISYKDIPAEVEVIGEKIARLYLYCKEEGITADEINNNKDWVLTFSPLDLKYLSAIKANSQFALEDIKKFTNDLVLEDKVTTFLKTEVNSPVAVEPILPTKIL